ncbi:hypothetical protein ONS95_002056 [Cadophora gregata]|uniref:uncharacterized protein n=1 Tax=Cadophora gregata TaxID=51156 RepID=UPI0026DB6374|nr:uncharacterized protein ONS95_002056 [Cadophora gregata]KAK0111713.1 hypothetical protein ONS95_002056 [Cadophora gregata]
MSAPLAHDSSTDKTQGETYGQREYTEKRTFGQKAKRHCARFWWAHLIAFCLIFLTVALLVVYVGMPRIAQHQVDDSSLEFREAYFLNPTADTVEITQKAILHNPSTFTPTLDPFPADLFLVTNGIYSSVSMLTLPMPGIHAKKATNTSIDNQVVKVNSLDALGDYAVGVMTQENITTALVGRTKLHLGKLPVQKIKFNSTSTYKTLNSLKGFNTTDVLINPLATPGTPNLKGNAFIPNPSLLTIEMGNVTLSLSVPVKGVDTIVGNATILNFKIVPGSNSLPMTGTIDNSKVLPALVNGKVNMTIIGETSIRNGEHLTYYEKALKSNVLVLEMNVQQILADSAASLRAASNSTSSATSSASTASPTVS